MASRPVKIAILADGKTARREFDKTSRSGHNMGAALAKAGRLGAVGLAVGLGAAAVAAAKLAQGAASDQAAASKLAQTLKTAAGATKGQVKATEDYITAQGKAFGVADDLLRPALGRLAVATGDVGKAQKLTSLALDVSAGTGKSLEQVTTALAKAQNGSLGGLSKLGIATKNASGETKTLAQVQGELADKFKGAAATQAGTLQGKLDKLKVTLSEAGESIGYKLIPPLTTFATYVADKVVPAAFAFGRQVGDKLGPSLAKLGGFLSNDVGPALARFGGFIKTDVLPVLERFGGFIKNEVAPVVADLARNAIAGLRDAFATLKSKGDELQPTLDLGKAALKALGTVMSEAVVPALKFAAKNVFPEIGRQVGNVIEIVGALSKAAIFLYNNAFQPTFKFILNGIADVLGAIGSMLGALGHVPGFGWAKDAADKLNGVADGARDIADKLGKIPPYVEVTVQLHYPAATGPSANQQNAILDGLSDHRVAAGRSPLVDRLIATVTNGSEGITAAVEKVANLTDRAIEKSLAATTKRLRKSGLKGDALDKALRLAERAAQKAHTKITKAIREESAALRKNGQAQDQNARKLETRTAKLKDLLQSSRAYAKSIQDTVVGYGSVTDFQPDRITAQGLTDSLAARVKNAKHYAALLKQLAKDKLNKTSLQQLLDAGVEGGLATAQAIASGGKTTIAQINALTADLAKTGGGLGKTFADKFYGAGIATAQAFVDRLTQRQKQLDAAAERMARKFAQTILRDLGGRKGPGGRPLTAGGLPAARQATYAASPRSPETVRLEIKFTAQELSKMQQGNAAIAVIDYALSKGARPKHIAHRR